MREASNNPLIGDKYFHENPTAILGTQELKTGKFGNEIVVVSGGMEALEKIDVVPLPPVKRKINTNLAQNSKQDLINETVLNEQTKGTKARVTKQREKGKKRRSSKASSGFTKGSEISYPNQQSWGIRDTMNQYCNIVADEESGKKSKKNFITRMELEAYFFTHPEFDYTLYFDKYTYKKEDFIKAGLLCFIERKVEYGHTYRSGHVNRKVYILNRDKDRFIEEFGENQWEFQKNQLEEAKNATKTFSAEGDQRIVLLPHSKLASEFKIETLRFDKPQLPGSTTLKAAFIMWVREVPPHEFKLSNYREVIDYYVNNKALPTIGKTAEEKKASDKININIKQRTKDEGDRLFGKFLAEQLGIEDQAHLARLWNEKYNSIVEPLFHKFPVGFRMSKTWKTGVPFVLGSAQVEAVQFLTEKKSGLLAYDVGVGKTAASIAVVSSSIDNGLADYPMFVVPTNTLKKWMGELQGYFDPKAGEAGLFMEGLLPHLPPVVELGNMNKDIVRYTLKEYSDEEYAEINQLDNILLALKEVPADFDFSAEGDNTEIFGDYQVNFVEITNSFRGFLTRNKDSTRTYKQHLARYISEELEYLIYSYGQIKQFPKGTIFITTENGIQRLGLKEDRLVEERLYSILSQGEVTSDDDDDDEDEDAKAIARLRVKIKEMMGSTRNKARVPISDLGIDFACFDESHYYKKVFVYVKGAIKSSEDEDTVETSEATGLVKRERAKYEISSGSAPSARAMSAFVICQYIQQQNDGRNVMHLTATPFTNSPLEIYSMLALTSYEQLDYLGMASITEFFDTFMKVTYDIKYNAKKQIVKDQVLTGYNNLPELRQLIYSFMNYKTGEDANIIRPVNNTWPNFAKGIETTMQMTPLQQDIMKQIKGYIAGNESLKSICAAAMQNEEAVDYDGHSDEDLITVWEGTVDKEYEFRKRNDGDNEPELSPNARQKMIKAIEKETKKDNTWSLDDLSAAESAGIKILRGLSLMKQVSLSPYLYTCMKAGGKEPTPDQYVESSPKFKYAFGCVKSELDWAKKNEVRASGKVMYMNAGIKPEFKNQEGKVISKWKEGGFVKLKQYAMAHLGLKESEVVLVYGGMPAAAKEKAKESFLRGDALLLIGSQSIAVGVDLQDNGSSMFNLWFDWNPTDAKQVSGRIHRQGNRHANVRIVYPMLANSSDPVIFQYLEEKTARIKEIWDKEGRTATLDLRDFNPKELKFKLITDPEEKADLDVMRELDDNETAQIRLQNNLEALGNAQQSNVYVLEHRQEVVDYLTDIDKRRKAVTRKEGIEATAEGLRAIMENKKFIDKEGKKNSDAIAKAVKTYQKNRYNYEGDPEKRYTPRRFSTMPDEEIVRIIYNWAVKADNFMQKLNYSDEDAYSFALVNNRYHIINILTRWRAEAVEVDRAKKQILEPMGIDVTDMDRPKQLAEEKLRQLVSEAHEIEKSRATRVLKYRREQLANAKNEKTVEDRIEEYAAANDAMLRPQMNVPKPPSPPKPKANPMKEKLRGKIDKMNEYLEMFEDDPEKHAEWVERIEIFEDLYTEI